MSASKGVLRQAMAEVRQRSASRGPPLVSPMGSSDNSASVPPIGVPPSGGPGITPSASNSLLGAEEIIQENSLVEDTEATHATDAVHPPHAFIADRKCGKVDRFTEAI